MAGHKPLVCGEAGPFASKKGKRQVTKAMFEKLQHEHERDHQMLSWLRCNVDTDKHHMASLYCAVCSKYEDSLQSLKSFSQAWTTDFMNLKVSNVLDLSNSEVHQAEMAKRGWIPRKKAVHLSHCPPQLDVVCQCWTTTLVRGSRESLTCAS